MNGELAPGQGDGRARSGETGELTPGQGDGRAVFSPLEHLGQKKGMSLR